MRLCTIYLLALAALAADATDANWPQFRGPSANGVGAGAPPIEWNVESGKNIRWKTAIPGLGHSSPVVWGDRIFVTSAVPASGESSLKVGLYGSIAPVKGEPAQSFNVYCLDRKSGKILWERVAASGQPKIMRHPKSTHANPTPATDGKHLAVFFGSEGLFTYDLDGKLLWKKDFGVLDAGFYMVPGAQWGFASSPVIHGNMLIIEADVQKDSFVEVVVNGLRHIAGYDLSTGKELWSMKGAGDIPVPTPVFEDGLVVITNAHGRGRPIYAIRSDAAGDITDSKSAIAWSEPSGGNYMQTPLLDNGLGYFCFDSGVLSVYKMASGERQYQQRLGGGTSGFTSSPVAAGNHLYITNEEGHSYVLALGAEYKLLAENEIGETVMATPAISGGVLYMRGGKHLFAIGAKE